MRTRGLCLYLCLGVALACTPASEDDGGDDGADGESSETAADDETSSGEGEGEDEGEAPTPAEPPTPTGTCPSFTDGYQDFEHADIEPRSARVWVGDAPTPGGMVVLYWHGYGSAPEEAVYSLSQPVIDAITAQGGVVVAPTSAPDSGEFPWFAVNASDREDDMLLGDEIVACAIQELGVDPRRVHVTGMSAGGLQTAAFAMARSRYVASVASYSGGVFSPLEFEDPSNLFSAMIIHGGETDVFGGFVNFDDLSKIWFDQLVANGNFAFMCDHGGGHVIPQGYGVDVVNFFFGHPFGTVPSPYAEGLPSELPSDCTL